MAVLHGGTSAVFHRRLPPAQALGQQRSQLGEIAAPYSSPPSPTLPLHTAKASNLQVATQLPGALLTINPGGAPQGGASVRVAGYASSAPLLRSNIVVCDAVLHVVGAVLLVGAPSVLLLSWMQSCRMWRGLCD